MLLQNLEVQKHHEWQRLHHKKQRLNKGYGSAQWVRFPLVDDLLLHEATEIGFSTARYKLKVVTKSVFGLIHH